MLIQEKLIARVCEICTADPGLDAALMYGSFAAGEADEYSDVEYVFKAHSTTRPPVREYVADLWARRQFMKALAAASLRGERSNTFMGEMWGVLDPLFQAAIYIFVVAVIRGGRGGGDGANHPHPYCWAPFVVVGKAGDS